MVHYLRLQQKPFDSIKNKTKTIEMRLYDEKRQQIKVDDIICFSLYTDKTECFKVQVKQIKTFNSFEELYKNFDKKCLGYQENENASYKDMEHYYSKEEQSLFGVVAIEVELI